MCTNQWNPEIYTHNQGVAGSSPAGPTNHKEPHIVWLLCFVFFQEKPVVLTTFRRLFLFNPTLLYIKDLTPKYGGQFKPVVHGQGFRLF
jgi:hypothetical protein